MMMTSQMKIEHTHYKYLVTLEKGTDKVKYHYYSLEAVREDMAYDLHKYLQKGYTVKIDKIR